MRIKEPSGQVGYVLVVVIGMPLVLVPLSAVSFELGVIWAVVALVSAAIVSARTFRGPAESDARRPWWRMTYARRMSIALALFFFAQGACASIAAGQFSNPPLVFVGGVVLVLVAGLYLNSAIRMGSASGTE